MGRFPLKMKKVSHLRRNMLRLYSRPCLVSNTKILASFEPSNIQRLIATHNQAHEDDEGEEDNNDKPTQKMDNFTEKFMKNKVELSRIQKTILVIGSSVAALVDPRRQDMIACLGETTGTGALQNILDTMRNNEEGKRILLEKPRINTKTVDIDQLKQLPENTLGRTYVKFLDDNKVTPDSRMDVRFMDDPQLAYVMTRYRECHDLIHTILDMPTNMLGEVAVKWVEALNTGLPMCYGGAVFGAMRLRPKQRKEYITRYLPWAIENGNKIKPLLLVYWEKRWDQNIDKLREELGITKLRH